MRRPFFSMVVRLRAVPDRVAVATVLAVGRVQAFAANDGGVRRGDDGSRADKDGGEDQRFHRNPSPTVLEARRVTRLGRENVNRVGQARYSREGPNQLATLSRMTSKTVRPSPVGLSDE